MYRKKNTAKVMHRKIVYRHEVLIRLCLCLDAFSSSASCNLCSSVKN